MVAAAKLRRAQQAAQNARHYTEAIWDLATRLALASQDGANPLTVAKEEVKNKEYLILTSDRGLCGGFNSNLLRRVGERLEKDRVQNRVTECRMIGKKGRDFFKSRDWDLKETATDLYDNLSRGIPEKLAEVAIRHFESGRTDEVWLAYNYFKSAMVQEVTLEKILPLAPSLGNEKPIDYIYEPSREGALDQLLRESVVAKIYGAFLESIASELAARMTAMESATSNCSDMIDHLTLQYNRARQATITSDLMDIINGAEALQ